MRLHGWKKWAAGAGAICVAIALAVVIAFAPIAAGVARGAAHAMGYDLRYDALSIHSNHLTGRNLVIRTNAGEPVAAIASLDATYSIADALRGARMYGIRSFDVERPRITLIRHRDGTWNVSLPKQNQGATRSTKPMIFTGVVRNGSVDVIDEAQGVPSARHLMVRTINAAMDVASNARTTYDATLAYEEAGQSYPVRGTGTIDVHQKFGLQRWTAAQLPIAHLVDVAVNSPSMHVAGGSLRNLDAQIVTLGESNGTLDQHVDATALLDKARIAVGGLRKPLRDVRGQLAVYGDGLLLQKVRATIAGVPIALGGGIYNLSSPEFRLTVAGNGDLRDLRTVLAQSSSLPISGRARLNVLVEGHPSKPLILIAVQSPRVHYEKAFVENPDGLIAFDGQEADIVRFSARYAGITMALRGKAALRSGPRAIELVTVVSAPANAIPFAGDVVAAVPVQASALISSDSLKKLDGRGVVSGRSKDAALSGVFDMAGNGVGTVGPVRITNRDGSSLYASAFVDRPHQRIDALLDATRFRVHAAQLAGTVDGRIAGEYDRGKVQAGGWTQLRNVRTPYTSVARADVRFGQTGSHGLALALDASGIGALGAVATAMVSYKNGTVDIHDATASLADSFVDARGSIAGLTNGRPRYDLKARMHSANLSSLVALAQSRNARLVEGSGNATLRVRGSGSHPSVQGAVYALEGEVNGLPFHALNATFGGTPSSLAMENGTVDVGSTAVRFHAAYAPGNESAGVSASRADLADFNDFFDEGDMLAGTGRISAYGAIAPTGMTTNGNVGLHNVQFRNFVLGTTNARWVTRGDRVNTSLAFGGGNGTVRADGAITTNGSIAHMAIHARNVNIGDWLAMGGSAMPVTGVADADATVAGRFPSLRGSVNAHAREGSFNRVPVERFDIAAALSGHRGTLRELAITVPNAHVSGSGTFGLRPNDPLDVVFTGQTHDVGALARTVSAKDVDASGAVRSSLKVSGTRLHPRIDDRFTGTQLRYGRFIVPRAAGEIRADERTVALSRTEIDLNRGRLLLGGSVPVSLAKRQIDPSNRPIAFTATANDIEAADFMPLLPDGTRAAGRVDGKITAKGTVRDPSFAGLLTLAGGAYSSPLETVPMQEIGGQLAFSGTTATLRNAHATLGGGRIDADGRAAIPDVHDVSKLAMQLNARAQNADVDSPAYVKGRFNGDLHVTKAPSARPFLAGTIETDSARIPMTALYNPKTSNAPPASPPNIGLGLHVVAGRDVRVQSPNVDVGAQGFVDVGGSFAQPALSGTLRSTGGTVSFLRTFRIERGTVRFDPTSGIVPYVNAVATTHVDDPPTDVALQVKGPATGLNIAFASTPEYDRQQILGLLVNAQSLGAVQGVASNGKGASFSATGAVNGIAEGQLNTLFTRNLLEPFDVAAGGALGLSNLEITNDLQAGFGLNAVKAFGKTMTLVYADTFNLPRRQSLTLQAHPSAGMQYSLSLYNTQGESLMALEQPLAMSALQPGFGNSATIPMDTGANGVDLKLEKKFP
jgi:hypothetical protein